MACKSTKSIESLHFLIELFRSNDLLSNDKDKLCLSASTFHFRNIKSLYSYENATTCYKVQLN